MRSYDGSLYYVIFDAYSSVIVYMQCIQHVCTKIETVRENMLYQYLFCPDLHVT